MNYRAERFLLRVRVEYAKRRIVADLGFAQIVRTPKNP
jgi:hypothetical protein